MTDDTNDDQGLIASLDRRGIRLWLDQGVLMIKVVEPYGDSVELNEDETDELIEALREGRWRYSALAVSSSIVLDGPRLTITCSWPAGAFQNFGRVWQGSSAASR
jgi:hypothetical protein